MRFALLLAFVFAVSAQAAAPAVNHCSSTPVQVQAGDVRAMLPPALKDLYQGPHVPLGLVVEIGPTMPPPPWGPPGSDVCWCYTNMWDSLMCFLGNSPDC